MEQELRGLRLMRDEVSRNLRGMMMRKVRPLDRLLAHLTVLTLRILRTIYRSGCGSRKRSKVASGTLQAVSATSPTDLRFFTLRV